MAVYYKFKSAKDYDSIPVDGHFISVAYLKEKIFESKHLGRGTDFDLVVTNAQTNEEYLDEAMLIPKNTSVLIRRVPGRPRMPIVTEPVIEQDKLKMETNKSDDAHLAKSSFLGADLSVMKYPDDSELDEFGNDLYAISEVLPVQASNPFQDPTPPSKADEDSKIKALVDTSALDWQCQISDGFGRGRRFGRGMGGRMMGGRGFGQGGLERKTPPQGYICHRCKVPGHFIQHCPTNGDPNYDIKRMRPPTGIPKSMLIAAPDGSYALPSGAVAVLNPNEAAFEKEIEGLPSTRSVGDFPPELHCPLCKEVMKDAVLTSKCCFESFCDRCIRDQIISKSMCVCGAINVLADDLLPNKTLRDTINRILESNNSSADNADMESKIREPKVESKVPSPPLSAASKGGQIPQPQNVEMAKVSQTAAQANTVNAPEKTSEKDCTGKLPDASEATHDSRSAKEPVSLGSGLLGDEMQQKPVSGDAGKKKKKKKTRSNDMQWTIPQGFAAENHMMPLGPLAYNPYWTGMQPGIEGYLAPHGGPLPSMGFGPGPLDINIPFGALPQDPFGVQGYMMPSVPPQRNLVDFGMSFNGGTPIMSRAQFEARKAELRRKREIERWDESRERELGREVRSGGDVSSLKSKSNSPSTGEHLLHRDRPERSPEHHVRDPLPRPALKRKSAHDRDDYDHRDRDEDYHRGHHHHRSEPTAAMPEQVAKSTTTDRKQKGSVFSRISFPEKEQPAVAVSKKRKVSSSEALVGGSSASSAHHSHKVSANGYLEDRNTTSSLKKASAGAADYESSDDERHFKRRPSERELSAPHAAEEARHSRGSREKDRDRGNRGSHR